MPLSVLVAGAALASLRALPANSHYVNQRAPLEPSPLQKLPVGSVRAAGWLKVQLDLQRKGFSGQLPLISKFLDIKNNAWMGNGTADRAGWEELPYWLRGQISLAYTTGDKKLVSECQQWVEGVLKTAQPDGWFGPKSNKDTKLGTPDLWPNMLMQDVLQTYFEATGDQRVLSLLGNYSRYLSSLDDKSLIDPRHYWHYHRVADQLANLVWLYNRTGNAKIIDLAARFHRASSNWTDGIPNWHGVNFAQGFREPATYSLFSKDKTHWHATEHDLADFRKLFGQVPGGMYAADENARKGYTDPRQATESCAIAEMMFSNELLMLYSGDPKWADEAEDVAYNEMPVTMTPDLKALRYLQSANMAVSDSPSKSPGVENGGPMFLMDPNDHRCCQHNIGMGWPYLTEHLWTATNGNGLAAMIYAPSQVTAKVGKSSQVTVTEKTDYPFNETVTFTFKLDKPTDFPLSLRIPNWCGSPKLNLNGRHFPLQATGGLVTFTRKWKSGDKITLTLPMTTRVKNWSVRPGTVSVWHGPLAYSLKIAEKYVKLDRPSGWPAYEIYPQSAWNYGLVPKTDFVFDSRPLEPGIQPFDLNNVPVSLTAKGRRIRGWTMDMYGLVAPLQESPARTFDPIENVTLVPMGAARLRITVFPTVVDTADGHIWKASPQPKRALPTTFSHKNWFDNEGALTDGLLPKNSHDQDVPRFTWWDHKGTEEWVAIKLPEPRTVSTAKVYWFDDQPDGGCRVPANWKLQVKKDGTWADVKATSLYTVVKDDWSRVTFEPVRGTEFRMLVQLQDDWSAGVLEWQLD